MPRLGSHIKKVTLGTARFRIWRSMRILRSFTIPQLVATSDATKKNATSYVSGLARNGYLRVTRTKKPGAPGVYMLARNTGPNPPRVGHDHSIYDPNLAGARR
ncbi:MAG TPA: hypothetical protein VMV27_02030 [Candidatus Binataceae bacterium]|nr:hypothetical protein [Candidatus Binataceae bacterium]